MGSSREAEFRGLEEALGAVRERLRVLAGSSSGVVPPIRMRALLGRELAELERRVAQRFAWTEEVEHGGGVLAEKPHLERAARRLRSHRAWVKIAIRWLRHRVEQGGDLDHLKHSVFRVLDRLEGCLQEEHSLVQSGTLDDLGTAD